MDTLVLLIILVAVAAGVGLGWYLGNRQAAALRAERDKAMDDFKRAIVDLAGAEERARIVPDLQAKLEEVR
jgi:DNA recombination protein RmuC